MKRRVVRWKMKETKDCNVNILIVRTEKVQTEKVPGRCALR